MASDAGQGRKRWDALIARVPQGVPLIGAEVGVWTGKFSERVLRALPLLTLYLVDRWCPPPPEDSYAQSGAKMAGYDEQVYRNALEQTRRKCMFAGERAQFRIGDSVTIARIFKDASLDFVFIDGDHSYTGCLRDILAWAPKVKAGGWIGGHDYAHPDQGGVKDAVLHWLDTPNKLDRLELDGNRTWWVRA